ncbi:DUF1549 domain-containing protein [Acanthopleuribacter pedis]|uniref:DUF1549 domain-containing protein n=1 Tax=Acanthopleuribacter pedis TaxID=442870 RepID=A0A8J7Q3T6_9BACT|nr:DUF1549 domain-containing protein [Acanthopleuribacter pedis]MBO1317146.1 DUF1549 domain-containing protein [Acanthopleuribacter pedis]
MNASVSMSIKTLAVLLVCSMPSFPWPDRAMGDDARAEKLTRLNQHFQTTATRHKDGNCLADQDKETNPAALNEIDNHTFAKMQADGVPINDLCDDSTFIRRTALILTGRLPDPARTRSFLSDTNPDKRAEYIDELLQSEAFNIHWAFYFQEFFESAGQVLFGGLLPYNTYFSEAVSTNKTLDTMAREMIAATGNNLESGQLNFLIRSTNRARLPQDQLDNIAIAATTKFMGIPAECISCHDGAYHLETVNLYLAERKREDLWKMAAYFSATRFRANVDRDRMMIESFDISDFNGAGYNADTEEGDRPERTGGIITPAFLTTGAVPQGNNWRQAFADQVVEDRQFARHWANRLWGHVFGLAPVEPMDSFDMYRIDPNRPLPEGWDYQANDLNLLEHITDALIERDFDLRDYLRYVLNSATFQMASTFEVGSWQDQYTPYYTRYPTHRMTAEQAYDALQVATGVHTGLIVFDRNTDTRSVLEWAHQLPDPSQPRANRGLNDTIFLNAFGRGNRVDQPRVNSGNISQAMLLMNSPVIHDRLLAPEGRLMNYLNRGVSDVDTLINDLFLDIYARPATESERTALKQELATYTNTRDQAATLMWLLINRVEFTFIY